jgi:hypothetical protein
MKKFKGIWLLVSAVLFFFIEAAGFSKDIAAQKKPYHVPRITSKINIDGIVEEKAWEDALVLELNYEVDPGENIKPPVKTEVLLAYDSDGFYVAFKAYDPEPAKIRANFTDRDNIYNDDYVGILLDTFNDSRRAYSLYCNPYGIQAEEIVTPTDYIEWDGIWKSAGKITDTGFVVEMAIPFSSLRFQAKKEDQIWGIDAMRVYPRGLTHHLAFVPRDRSNTCYICQFDKIIGFKVAKTGLNLELDPTLSMVLTQERESFPHGKFVKKNSDLDPGLTTRWSFTPNLSLGATINPDFSQVEADAAQLDINTQFVLYYPEKRPFFLEGANIFSTPLDVVYTRTIADPDWGIKLTGKEGKHALGFFFTRDTVTNLIFPSSQGSNGTSLDLKNFSTVLRYSLDLGKSSTLGVVITDREGEEYLNRVAGIDGDLRFTKSDQLLFQMVGSQTHYPQEVVKEWYQPGEKFTGGALDFYYSHDTRNVNFFAGYQDISADFRSDAGFNEQADFILYRGGAGYTWYQNPGHWYTRLNLQAGYIHKTDHDKNLLNKSFYVNFTFRGIAHSVVTLETDIGKRSYAGQVFDENFFYFTMAARPSGPFYFQVTGVIGDQIDFANVRPGNRVLLSPIIQYNVGRRLYFGLNHVFERLNVEGGRLYTANVSNIRISYQFSRTIFLRVILQYTHLIQNRELYSFPVYPKFKQLFSQVLFSYKINPRTVLFLGYSDDYYGFRTIPLTQNNRTFFMKIGYALVL